MQRRLFLLLASHITIFRYTDTRQQHYLPPYSKGLKKTITKYEGWGNQNRLNGNRFTIFVTICNILQHQAKCEKIATVYDIFGAILPIYPLNIYFLKVSPLKTFYFLHQSAYFSIQNFVNNEIWIDSLILWRKSANFINWVSFENGHPFLRNWFSIFVILIRYLFEFYPLIQ